MSNLIFAQEENLQVNYNNVNESGITRGSFQSYVATGQNEREKLAGLELKKFANHHYLGTALGVGGGVMFVAGYSIYNNAYYNGQFSVSQMSDARNKRITGTYLMFGGHLLTLAGLVYKIEAPLHIKKAGLILSGNGVSINVKLN